MPSTAIAFDYSTPLIGQCQHRLASPAYPFSSRVIGVVRLWLLPFRRKNDAP